MFLFIFNPLSCFTMSLQGLRNFEPNFATVIKQFPAKHQCSFIVSYWNSILSWTKLNQESIHNYNLLNFAAALFTHSVANLVQLYINNNRLHCESKNNPSVYGVSEEKMQKYQLPLYQIPFCFLRVCVHVFSFFVSIVEVEVEVTCSSLVKSILSYN